MKIETKKLYLFYISIWILYFYWLFKEKTEKLLLLFRIWASKTFPFAFAKFLEKIIRLSMHVDRPKSPLALPPWSNKSFPPQNQPKTNKNQQKQTFSIGHIFTSNLPKKRKTQQISHLPGHLNFLPTLFQETHLSHMTTDIIQLPHTRAQLIRYAWPWAPEVAAWMKLATWYVAKMGQLDMSRDFRFAWVVPLPTH